MATTTEFFGVWINNETKASDPTKMRHGYAMSTGDVTPWRQSAAKFASKAAAESFILAMGMERDTSVRPGRATAYVVSIY